MALQHLTKPMSTDRHLRQDYKERPRLGREAHVQGEGPAAPRTTLFVTNAGGFGGTEKHLLELIKRLDRSTIRPLIVQLGANVYAHHLTGNDLSDVRVRSEKIRNSPLGWFRFFRTARPDIVVFVNSWVRCFPWYSSVTAFLAGVPRRVAIQHLIAEPLSKVPGWSARNVSRRMFGGRARMRMLSRVSGLFCDATVCVSNAVRDRLVADYRFPAHKTVTIYNGVSLSEFVSSESNRTCLRAKLGVGAEEFLLVCVARLSEVKGIDILLLAMARVLRNGLNCKCVIVGDGPLRKSLSEQAEALGLRDRVFFEGFHEDVRSFLQAGDGFVLTSHSEGLPLSILEAMACGLPCVLTDVGGNAEAIHHMVHGLIVPPGSVDDAADAISFLVTHPRERTEMSRMGRARVCEVFDVEDRMADIERVILN